MTDLAVLNNTMRAWRHDLHRHPEVGFAEIRTAAFVAETLRGFGLDVTERVGGTGVVATLRRGTGNRSVALRADMDALRITEATGARHGSTEEGLMHACGHDGHTAMLLGAASLLAGEGGFDGTVCFIFQPAEEWGQGALAMMQDGLRERFPFDEIFGLHNRPGLPVGHFETRAGPIMAAEDVFEITLSGQGGHASAPHESREVMVPGCELVLALQAIVARRSNPFETAVVSVTEFLADGTRNALPGTVRIKGDARSYKPQVSALIEAEMRRITDGIAIQHGVKGTVSYQREFIATINDAAMVSAYSAAAGAVSRQVDCNAPPMSASEDFARFLKAVPGCFAFIGNGENSAPLHAPNYDFNDDALLHGALLHAAIVRERLPTQQVE